MSTRLPTVPVEERGRALEEAFFRQEDARVLARLRAKKEREGQKQALRDMSGVHDHAVLDALLDRGVTAAAMQAFLLVPVIEVAWADGEIQEGEREALLRAARDSGIGEETPGYALLHSALARRPDAELVKAWEAYVRVLGKKLPPAEFRILRDQTLGRAEEVADAAGGFLGLKTISDAEQKVLRRLAALFDEAEQGTTP